jgi:hypothetical protein
LPLAPDGGYCTGGLKHVAYEILTYYTKIVLFDDTLIIWQIFILILEDCTFSTFLKVATLVVVATYSFETVAHIFQTIWHHNPQDNMLRC